ncbi:hypothetical protein [uncultured Pontibacter sp.]|uniref:hypothetical protein n=1 Tax=uncultured Pontibacter sp. TaxID=453356 RepID=UPI002604B059|nr:hypothetical protein [uncultured Pontibacter sp.]
MSLLTKAKELLLLLWLDDKFYSGWFPPERGVSASPGPTTPNPSLSKEGDSVEAPPARATEIIPSLSVERLWSFSGDERQRGSPRHEGRKRSQRDAGRRGLPALREPKYKMKQAGCKAVDQQQLGSIACFRWQKAAAKKV